MRRQDERPMMTNRVVDASAATIHASLASRSASPPTTLWPDPAAQASVANTECATTSTTVAMPNQRCAASRWSRPYRRSRNAGRAVRMIAESDASAASRPVSWPAARSEPVPPPMRASTPPCCHHRPKVTARMNPHAAMTSLPWTRARFGRCSRTIGRRRSCACAFARSVDCTRSVARVRSVVCASIIAMPTPWCTGDRPTARNVRPHRTRT